MKLLSRTEPVYFPDADQRSVLRLGLQPMAESDWILIDDDLASFHQHKLEQYEKHPDKVSLALPGSEQAQQEFGQALLHHLRTHHADKYRKRGDEHSYVKSGMHEKDGEGGGEREGEKEIEKERERKKESHKAELDLPPGANESSLSSLWHCSLWVQEDFCLMESCDNEYILTAASLCSPSNWKLEDKIGKSLDVIHDPVPGYAGELSNRVNRLLSGLRHGKSVQRFNWSIQAGADLMWREDLTKDEDNSPYWRVERQTLVKLPITGAVVFGIRIYLHSFETMQRTPHFQSNLKHLLNLLPAEQKNYKGLQPWPFPSSSAGN